MAADAAPSFAVRMLNASSVRVVLRERPTWSVNVELECPAPPSAVADYAESLRRGLSQQSSGETVVFGRLPPARYKITVRGMRPAATGGGQTEEVVLSEHFVEARAGETATVEVRGR